MKALEWQAGEVHARGTGPWAAEPTGDPQLPLLSPYPRSRVLAALRGLGDGQSPKGIVSEMLLCRVLMAVVVGGTNSAAGTDPPRRELASSRFPNSCETENCGFAVCLVLVHVCLCLSDIFLFSCQYWVSLCGT